MLAGFIRKGKSSSKKSQSPVAGKVDGNSSSGNIPFCFEKDGYQFPSLYEEADEMTVVALLMYSMTELRALVRKNKGPKEILQLPITLERMLELIEENFESIQTEIAGHDMAFKALQSIKDRFSKHQEASQNKKSVSWFNPFRVTSGLSVESARLIAYGDDKSDRELVYAIGLDPLRKRVTVAFRGSVTPADFFTDACIELKHRGNPVIDLFQKEEVASNGAADSREGSEMIGIHHGFYAYLLKKHQSGGEKRSKYDEIVSHLKTIFSQDDNKLLREYKLYVTGHSLGGALACLFGFEVAASKSPEIPLPVTVISVASPRVGNSVFQQAFSVLETKGYIRHLRIAHAQDPVTMMPKTSSSRILATLSPLVFMTLALKDAMFTSRETYRHTGVKLRLLNKPNSDGKVYEISYQGTTTVQEEAAENDDDVCEKRESKTKNIWERMKGTTPSWSFSSVPGVDFHFGPTYMGQLAVCKNELSSNSLNRVYITCDSSTSKITGSL